MAETIIDTDRLIRILLDAHENLQGETLASQVDDVLCKFTTDELYKYAINRIYKTEGPMRDRFSEEIIKSEIRRENNPEEDIFDETSENIRETDIQIKRRLNERKAESGGISIYSQIGSILDDFSTEELYHYVIDVLYTGNEFYVRDRLEKDIIHDEIFRSKVESDIGYVGYKKYYENEDKVISYEDIVSGDTKGHDYLVLGSDRRMYDAKFDPTIQMMFYTIPSDVKVMAYILKQDTEKKEKILEPARTDIGKVSADQKSDLKKAEPDKSKVNPKLNKTRQQLVDMFLAALKSEEPMEWKKGWEALDAPHNAVSHKAYKGINHLLLGLTAISKGYTDPRWCTFKQANDNGWKIRKGEKSSIVEYWFLYDKVTKKHLTQSEYNAILKENPEYIRNIHLVSQEYRVFNAEQIEGIPVLEKQNRNKVERLEDVERFIDNLKEDMNIEVLYGGDRACYVPFFDQIHIPHPDSFLDEYEFYATELHEFAHATGAESRLERDLSGHFGSESYAKEELRAEISSCFLSNELGLPSASEEHNKNHAAYVKSWIRTIENDPAELMRAVKDADKITSYLKEKGNLSMILDKSKERNVVQPEKNREQDKLNNRARQQMIGRGR